MLLGIYILAGTVELKGYFAGGDGSKDDLWQIETHNILIMSVIVMVRIGLELQAIMPVAIGFTNNGKDHDEYTIGCVRRKLFLKRGEMTFIWHSIYCQCRYICIFFAYENMGITSLYS